jgi:hypothetical protein
MIECPVAVWINIIILSLAVGAAVWYAWETHKMRLQMIRAKVICLSGMPDAGGLFNGEFPAAAKLSISNVGEGAAINIQLRVGKLGGLELETEPRTIAVLKKGQEQEVQLRPASGSHRPDMTMLLSDSAVSVEVTASYSDVDGRRFTTTSRIGAGANPPFVQEVRNRPLASPNG